MPVINKKYGNPKNLPTERYEVAVEVQNLHINGVKAAKGQIFVLTAAAAEHWLREGVLTPAAPVAPTEG